MQPILKSEHICSIHTPITLMTGAAEPKTCPGYEHTHTHTSAFRGEEHGYYSDLKNPNTGKRFITFFTSHLGRNG